ncbi:hypothetical protein J4212_04320 [Candidatus Woesearchaeota archaeon]|nr:hypothetical protein [Candidatus Woesearchaeota archaeon]
MEGNFEINKEGNYILISVSPKLYPVDAVYSAAYVFTERNYVLVDGDPSTEIVVEIRPKEKGADLEKIGREFNNELVNYASYAVQAARNANLRETILQRVLLTNNPEAVKTAQPAGNDKDYPETEAKPWRDELQIARPWEEKYGKNKG